MTHLGGRMYGDGETIVEFRGGRDTQAPLTATIIRGDRFWRWTGKPAQRPSRELARAIAEQAR